MSDLTGQRFGRLVVRGALRVAGWAGLAWACVCDCGEPVTVRQADLVRKGPRATRSCGCLQRERSSVANRGERRALRHGHTVEARSSAEYVIWQSMRKRCRDPRAEGYERYGGRGIRVCDRWLGKRGFDNFIADMGPRPSQDRSIDRFPNNNGNYEPGNCRWATRDEQNANRRDNVFVEHEGQKVTMGQLAKRVGRSLNLISGRLRRGWSVADAISVPPIEKQGRARRAG